jgi:hypothetical protein
MRKNLNTPHCGWRGLDNPTRWVPADAVAACRGYRGKGESVLFIGTQFSNLYTAVDTPAEAE